MNANEKGDDVLTIKKEKIVGSHECVGKQFNSEWATKRIAHKKQGKSPHRPLIKHILTSEPKK